MTRFERYFRASMGALFFGALHYALYRWFGLDPFPLSIVATVSAVCYFNGYRAGSLEEAHCAKYRAESSPRVP